MRTIDEAIRKHKTLKVLAENRNDKRGAFYNPEEHEQLTEWLEDYKRLKELFSKTFIKDCNTCEQEIYQKAYKEGQDKGFSDGHFFGYSKAIDDFAEKIKYEYGSDEIHETIDEIAEQLKAGVNNES